MKKINRTINSLIASAIACLALTAAVPAVTFADEAPQTIGNPTFCFDNDSSNSMWSLYGPTDETGFKLSIAEDIKETGKGSLCISETVAKDIELDERYGGAFITAEQVGLESFAGCTFQVSAKFDEEAAKKADSFSIFSDGIVWIESTVSSDTAGRWAKVSLTVPETAKNNKLGFSIPVYTTYDGKVAYIDNVIIYKPDGTQVENVGDYLIASNTVNVSIGAGGRVALIILLVVMVAGLVLGAFFLIKSKVKRYR